MRSMIKKTLKLFKDADRPLLILSIVMFSLGLLNIATASSSEAITNTNYGLFHFFNRQLLILLFSIIPFIIVLKVPTKRYRPFAIVAFLVVFGLLIALSLSGVFHRGANNWLNILGSNSIQPSEFAKPVIIVSLALIFDIYGKLLHSKDPKRFQIFWLIMFVGLGIPAMVFIQKDLGTAIIMLSIFAVMFLASPMMRQDKFNIIGGFSLVAVIMLFIILINGSALLTDAQVARFNFFNPCARYETGGYQTCNGYIAINDGGLLGLGIGKSKQKYSYIPEPHTDSVFAIIAEENGFIRSSIVFVLYAVILHRILMISSRASTIRGRYIALGVATYIFIHIIINLGGLFALMPLTGVPLPFLSYGGSFALALAVSLALVQRVHIETKNQHLKL